MHLLISDPATRTVLCSCESASSITSERPPAGRSRGVGLGEGRARTSPWLVGLFEAHGRRGSDLFAPHPPQYVCMHPRTHAPAASGSFRMQMLSLVGNSPGLSSSPTSTSRDTRLPSSSSSHDRPTTTGGSSWTGKSEAGQNGTYRYLGQTTHTQQRPAAQRLSVSQMRATHMAFLASLSRSSSLSLIFPPQ